MHDPPKGPDAPLVYGDAGEGLVFLPKSQAEDLLGLWKALLSSTTWGDLRRSISDQR